MYINFDLSNDSSNSLYSLGVSWFLATPFSPATSLRAMRRNFRLVSASLYHLPHHQGAVRELLLSLDKSMLVTVLFFRSLRHFARLLVTLLSLYCNCNVVYLHVLVVSVRTRHLEQRKRTVLRLFFRDLFRRTIQTCTAVWGG